MNLKNKIDIMMTLFHLAIVVLMIFQDVQTAAESYCNDDIFLRVGHLGVVSCDFGEFDVVGWLYPTQDLETTDPFIYLERSEIRGTESGNGEYSMLPNGSLIIEDVTLHHENNYIVRIVKNGAVYHDVVPVKVYVLPVPEYPVVNGHTDQHRVIVNSTNGKASFQCTMDHVRPAVPLELVFVSNMSNGISMTSIPSVLNNPDGTYNVSLDTQLRIGITRPIGIYLQCRVAGKFAHLFPSVTSIVLIVHDWQLKFPVVNGLDNQQHIVLDVNRNGTLTCSMDRFSPNVDLDWSYIHHYSSNRVALERQRHSSFDNGDGTYNITSITSYKAISESIQSVTFKCGVSGKAAHLYPLYTTVELHFPAADEQHIVNFPSVNGSDNQQHIVLDVNRTGTLTCSIDSVPPNGYLEWNYSNRDSSTSVALEKQRHYSFDNGDGSYNIMSSTSYKTTGDSIQSVTLKCGISGKAAHLYPLFTTVELNFPAADSDSSINASQCKQPILLLVAFVSVVFISFT